MRTVGLCSACDHGLRPGGHSCTAYALSTELLQTLVQHTLSMIPSTIYFVYQLLSSNVELSNIYSCKGP